MDRDSETDAVCSGEREDHGSYRKIGKRKEYAALYSERAFEAKQRQSDLEGSGFISADGPADYLRPVLNKMDDKTFEEFIKYHMATCERQDTIGAAAHTVDILLKNK